MVKCAHCKRDFEPVKVGHRYCSPRCRHLGPSFEDQTVEGRALAWLFDETRDPNEPVGPDGWYPGIGTPDGDTFGRLEDPTDTVRKRRAWYERLVALRRV